MQEKKLKMLIYITGIKVIKWTRFMSSTGSTSTARLLIDYWLQVNKFRSLNRSGEGRAPSVNKFEQVFSEQTDRQTKKIENITFPCIPFRVVTLQKYM